MKQSSRRASRQRILSLVLAWLLTCVCFLAPASASPQDITLAELPAEAQRVLQLIAIGGPFPYRQDNRIFQNRERLLPEKPHGTYREYTVPTPGEHHRGARRIVHSRSASYYTADHYRSFWRIRP